MSMFTLSFPPFIRLKSEQAEKHFVETVRGDSVLLKMMGQQDVKLPWDHCDQVTQFLMESSRMKGIAARRQVLADTLQCCIVSEYTPQSGHEETLSDFGSDLDHKSVGVVSLRVRPDRADQMRVGTRRDAVDTHPAKHDIDLTLSSYMDSYSSEDLLTQLPLLDDGSVDTSTVAVITKTIPWFDEFVETVRVSGVKSLRKLQGLVQRNFAELKQFYLRLPHLYTSVYSQQWAQVVVEKEAALSRNFPKGILGLRVLSNPSDPRTLRALLVKQSDKSQTQILGGRKTDLAQEKELETEMLSELGPRASKYATVPDMKHVWTALPQVRWVDRNGIIPNMAHVEREFEMTPWTTGEIRQFLERLAVHGKNFKRIATVLPDKCEKDCVDLYYRFKVHLGMKGIISAGSQARQDRRNSSNNNGNYKALIEEVVTELENVLGESKTLNHHKQLEDWTLQRLKDLPIVEEKVYGRPVDGDESPRRERRNAMIEVITNVITRGHPAPPQLGIVVEATPSPVSTPPPPSSRLSLSIVRTEVAVLIAGPGAGPDRQLQPHNTI